MEDNDLQYFREMPDKIIRTKCHFRRVTFRQLMDDFYIFAIGCRM